MLPTTSASAPRPFHSRKIDGRVFGDRLAASVDDSKQSATREIGANDRIDLSRRAWPLRAKLAIEIGNCWLPTPVISTRSCATDRPKGKRARTKAAQTARRTEEAGSMIFSGIDSSIDSAD